MIQQIPRLTLFSAPRSGCSARVRIAARLKGIQLQIETVDVSNSQHTTHAYLQCNPNGSVPTLVFDYGDSARKVRTTITQSLACLEFLEEAFPYHRSLLPCVSRNGGGGLDPSEESWIIAKRSKVRELAALVSCDIQPPQNLRIRKEIEALGGNSIEYARRVIGRGLGVYERLVDQEDRFSELPETPRTFSVGNEITLADVCLVPMVQGGLRNGMQIDEFPLVKAIFERCMQEREFYEGGLQ